MTEEDYDRISEVKEALSRKITKLVNDTLAKAKVTPEQEDVIRTQLTEEYRFWK